MHQSASKNHLQLSHAKTSQPKQLGAGLVSASKTMASSGQEYTGGGSATNSALKMPQSNAKNFGPWSSANNGRQLGTSNQHPGSSFGYSSIGQGLGVQTLNGAAVATEQPQQHELHLDAQECD